MLKVTVKRKGWGQTAEEDATTTSKADGNLGFDEEVKEVKEKVNLSEPSPQAEHLSLLSIQDNPPEATLHFPATIGDFRKLKKAGTD